jgi:hypothetical protein
MQPRQRLAQLVRDPIPVGLAKLRPLLVQRNSGQAAHQYVSPPAHSPAERLFPDRVHDGGGHRQRAGHGREDGGLDPVGVPIQRRKQLEHQVTSGVDRPRPRPEPDQPGRVHPQLAA